jgi:hypothetical protein
VESNKPNGQCNSFYRQLGLGKPEKNSEGPIDPEHGVVIKTAKRLANLVARKSLRFVDHHLGWFVKSAPLAWVNGRNKGASRSSLVTGKIVTDAWA